LSGWLQREGFLAAKPHRDSALRAFAVARGVIPKGYGAIGWLRYGAKRFLPKTARLWMNQHLRGVKSGVESHISQGHIDWRQTRAYTRGQYGHIFINLKGRERFGIVQPGGEYEQVRSDIIDRLEALVDPHSGLRAVSRAHRREELYEGPQTSLAPDLIVEWRDSAYMPTEIGLDTTDIFVSRWRSDMSWPTSGSHRAHGILLAHGPGIAANQGIEGASTLDLMPTWLHCLGLTAPTDLHGRILTELFST
jgi:predicted AlkP superfamily phosphohydrolase/phosphomutase